MAKYITKEEAINAIANTDFKLSADNWTEIAAAIDDIPPSDVISVSKDVTNGDIIMAMFPNAKVRNSYYTYFVEVKLEYHSQYDAGLLFDKKWWDAPYNGECNLSEKSTGSESE